MILLFLCAFLLSFGILFAQEDPMTDENEGPPAMQHESGKHKRHGQRIFEDQHYLKDELKLSDEQIGKIRQINAEFKQNTEKIRETMIPEKKKLRELLLKENVNLAEVELQLKKIGNIRIEMQLNGIKHRLAIEKILTPEQKKKHRQEMRNKRKMERHDGK